MPGPEVPFKLGLLDEALEPRQTCARCGVGLGSAGCCPPTRRGAMPEERCAQEQLPSPLAAGGAHPSGAGRWWQTPRSAGAPCLRLRYSRSRPPPCSPPPHPSPRLRRPPPLLWPAPPRCRRAPPGHAARRKTQSGPARVEARARGSGSAAAETAGGGATRSLRLLAWRPAGRGRSSQVMRRAMAQGTAVATISAAGASWSGVFGMATTPAAVGNQ